MTNETLAFVIGAGPAGLMAAEELARAGHRTILTEARPTPARKFLMAGKSGLNLTRDESPAAFLSAYRGGFTDILAEFGPQDMMAFARDLGIDLFAGSTGRVFPVGMKASPMLRAWIRRLTDLGVEIRTRWRWTGFEGDNLTFDTPGGPVSGRADVTVLALGGASWPQLGSDAAWVPWLRARDVDIAPFRPANMGFVINWSDHMAPYLGQPLKGAALITPQGTSRGEFVLSRRGIEGGGVYAVAADVRDGAPLMLDLMPDATDAVIARRLARISAKESTANRLRKGLGLEPIKLALLNEWGRPLPSDPLALARRIKALSVPHRGPRPLAEAISSAGGIRADAVTTGLELRALPGVFVAGEMLDWEAPTGGYLLTGCFATGRHAGRAAAARLG
ncbi:MAG TPA: TIGR03862 family flavoprotein [Paenirhodobacter sp.]